MKIKLFKALFQLTRNVVSWIGSNFTLESARPIKEYHNLINKLEVILISRGELFFINYIKELRLALMKYLAGTPLKTNYIKLRSDNVPLILAPFIKKNISHRTIPRGILQLLMTILFMTRALNLGKIPDYSPLITPASGSTVLDENFIQSFWKELGYRPHKVIPKWLRFTKYHFTTKSGPNGHALFASVTELFNLPETLIHSIKVVGGQEISERIDTIFNGIKLIPTWLLPPSKHLFRKLEAFPDKELKMRIIAVGDYWSQTVLKPLHHYLFRVLKKIPQDCTFDQGKSKLLLLNKLDNHSYHSIDLTAATDRMPIDLIIQVLSGILPQDYLSSWKDIMVGYPFRNQEGKMISYAVGNPMGFYSSWSSFTVVHHYLVYHSCQINGIKWNDCIYCILGDDIVICHDQVAATYKGLLIHLGMEVSELKTHTSPHFYEFAKRYSFYGDEISPFPISALRETSKRSYLLVDLLLDLEERGYLSKESIPCSISSFYGMVKNLPSKFRKKIHGYTVNSELIMRIMRGNIEVGEGLKAFIKANSLPEFLADLITPPNGSPEGFLQNIAVELFADSNPENDKFKKASSIPLGGLAETLVCHFTSFESEEDQSLGFSLIYALPHLGAYALVEEMFIKLKKEAISIDRDNRGDWPLILKTMALPLDDTIFIQRSSHLIARGGHLISKRITDRFNDIVTLYGS